jgi:hypothetical protein
MQTLTFPASVSKRKQACRSCRQRKKRCDVGYCQWSRFNCNTNALQGEKPSCFLCNKWGTKCEYSVAASEPSLEALIPSFQYPGSIQYVQPPLPLDLDQDGDLDFMQYPGMNFGILGVDPSQITPEQLAYLTPLSGPVSLPAKNIIEFDQDVAHPAGLPSHEVLLELVDLFFQHFYHTFPCFHKKTFLEQVRNQHLQIQAPLVLYAICTLAARHHHDPVIRTQQGSWYEQAKFLYDLTKRDPEPALRTIQAVLCLVFSAWTVGDFSAGWLYLGKAWRQAVALSLNRIDGNSQTFYIRVPQWPKTVLEKEEYRRTLWVLFMMDRNYSWPTGWPNAIDEKQFKIDIPIAETLFQEMTSETSKTIVENTPFTRNLDALISSSSTAANPLNLFHYLAVAHVILGRLSEHVHSLHDSPDSPEYAQTAKELDAQLLKFRLSLPRLATSLLEASDDSRGLVIWLNITLNMMPILLHHRCEDERETQEQFFRALIASKSIVQIVKDTSRISIDLLLNAHVGSSLYIATCILAIQWRLAGDESLKADIDLFTYVFDRFHEVYYFLGLKFKLALEYQLKNASEEQMLILKERGFKGLLADCSRWNFVSDEMNKLDFGHTLT